MRNGRLSAFNDSTYYDRIVCSDPEDLNTCVRETGWEDAGGASYSYDQVGNRTDSNARFYANTNRYRFFAGDSLQYDAEGNLTARLRTGYTQRLYWNALNQLDSVVTNGSKVSYTYSGFGVRVRRTAGAASTISIYDGDDLLLEANGSNTVEREFLHYPGIDLPHSVRIGTTTYFYAMEQPGHVVGLATGASTVSQRYRYSPWGEVEQDSGGVTQPLRFMARELDGGTGMYYVRNRWYSPRLARFVSEDPIGLGGGINQSSYVSNDPMNRLDPFGLTWVYRCGTATLVVAGEAVQGRSCGWVWEWQDWPPAPGSSCYVHGCRLRPPRPEERQRVFRVLQGLRRDLPFCNLVRSHGLEAATRDLRFFDNVVYTSRNPDRQLFGNAPFDRRLGGPVIYLYGKPEKLYDSDIVHEAVHTVPRFSNPLQGYPDGSNPYYFTPLGSIDAAAAACRGS
jgi:RHS repeat-associated protein